MIAAKKITAKQLEACARRNGLWSLDLAIVRREIFEYRSIIKNDDDRDPHDGVIATAKADLQKALEQERELNVKLAVLIALGR